MPVPTPGVTSPFAIVDDGLCQLAAPGSCDPPAAIFGKKKLPKRKWPKQWHDNPCLANASPPAVAGFLVCRCFRRRMAELAQGGRLVVSPEPPVPCRKTDGLCRGVVFFLWIVPCGHRQLPIPARGEPLISKAPPLPAGRSCTGSCIWKPVRRRGCRVRARRCKCRAGGAMQSRVCRGFPPATAPGLPASRRGSAGGRRGSRPGNAGGRCRRSGGCPGSRWRQSDCGCAG